jgi:hypothetical protein
MGISVGNMRPMGATTAHRSHCPIAAQHGVLTCTSGAGIEGGDRRCQTR